MAATLPRARLKSSGAARQKPVSILVAAHSHPLVSKGGSEIAAFQLFSALRTRLDYDPWFLGCARDERHHKLGATFSQPFSEREYLYAGGAFDWFHFANRDPKFPAEFRGLLRRLQPRIVHFHHYLNFGVEAFLHVREILPQCRIVVTLHEYLAICHQYGQMVTKRQHGLCHEATPMRCADCFPDIAPSDFFLRGAYVRRFFDLVDQFIAPSRFLADRYIQWGIAQERVTVIENLVGPSLGTPAPLRPRTAGDLLRVGFFGQISVLKGINVLFDAAELLFSQKTHHIVFEIYGDPQGQPVEFQEDFAARLAKAGSNVKFHGAYDHLRVDRLMQAVDVVLVPSIWWENSPLVIQEALRNRRPVLCSDIGGMAEKVRPGVDGFHVPVGNAVALAALLLKLAGSPTLLADVSCSLAPPAPFEAVMEHYLQCYNGLLAGQT